MTETLKKLHEVVIFDLEGTCDDKSLVFNFDNETIEIGAVKMMDHEIVGEFSAFIKPRDTAITPFCTELTTITAADVEEAPDFLTVIQAFGQFVGNAKILSWGKYDRNQLAKDFERHNTELPKWLQRHLNLKAEFAQYKGVRLCVMKRALAHCNIPLEGTHHRGIDDARNIAKIYLQMKQELDPYFSVKQKRKR
ncbi:MAG: 3'-5' exonuclease [Solibacillus sp.]